MLGDDLTKVRGIHVFGENFLILLHSIDEKSFESLNEDVAELIECVSRGRLSQLLIGDGFFAKLVEERPTVIPHSTSSQWNVPLS